MRYYTEEHTYVDVVGDEVTVGISEYAANMLGDISSVELPEEDDDFIIGDRVGEIEGDSSSMELVAPISGTVSQINESLPEDPGLVAESPEDKGWLFRLVDIDSSELDDMLTEDEYMKLIADR